MSRYNIEYNSLKNMIVPGVIVTSLLSQIMLLALSLITAGQLTLLLKVLTQNWNC